MASTGFKTYLNHFQSGFAPDPTEVAYNAPPDSLDDGEGRTTHPPRPFGSRWRQPETPQK